MSVGRARVNLGLVAVAALGLLGCGGPDGVLSVNGMSDRRLSVAVGQELDVALGTVGGGEFASPPMISSPVLVFLGDSVVGPYTPGGPNQRFRFRAQASGQATITFLHTFQSVVVVDTVVVR